jgi:pimeloyl-ACP methyl ester carboxylesterase
MIPLGAKSAPGAVIVHGSGDSDRDNVWAFSIANHLALSGVAVLLPDKRGSGKSGGNWKAVGFDELAADALLGVELLARQAEVDPARVGLVGLSQGGWVAPLAASRSPRVAFSASISAAAVSVREQVLHELEQTVRKAGADPETVGLALELMRMTFAYGETGAGWEEYLAAVELAPAALSEAFPTSQDDWRWSWYERVLDFDPLPVWRGLSIPYRIVYGEKDEQDNLPVEKSVARLRSWLAESGRKDVEVSVVPDSGHALEDPATGWIRRSFLDDLARWVVGTPAGK